MIASEYLVRAHSATRPRINTDSHGSRFSKLVYPWNPRKSVADFFHGYAHNCTI